MLAGGSGGGAWSQNVDCDIFPLHYLSTVSGKPITRAARVQQFFFYLFLGIE